MGRELLSDRDAVSAIQNGGLGGMVVKRDG